MLSDSWGQKEMAAEIIINCHLTGQVTEISQLELMLFASPAKHMQQLITTKTVCSQVNLKALVVKGAFAPDKIS